MNYYVPLQVMLTLRFYATGTFKRVIDKLFGIDRSTASHVASRVTCEIAAKMGLPQNPTRRFISETEILY